MGKQRTGQGSAKTASAKKYTHQMAKPARKADAAAARTEAPTSKMFFSAFVCWCMGCRQGSLSARAGAIRRAADRLALRQRPAGDLDSFFVQIVAKHAKEGEAIR